MSMSVKRFPLVAGTAGLSLALLGAGCATDETEADEIASALEQENGGLDTADELPQFGDEALFETAIDPVTDFADPMDSDPAVVAMMGGADAALYNTALQWGQMPPDPTTPAARDWSGTLRVNRGAIIIRRVVRFEEATDSIAPRTAPDEVAFTSLTRPANDGLRLTIVDPDPGAADPLVLTYETADGAHSVALADLVAGPQSVVVDDLGNRMAGVAFRERTDVCEHGFLAGRWHQLRPGIGRLVGVVQNEEGEVIGHLRGLYGARRTGEHVFFGKFIGRDGRFRGIFAGGYRDGHFAGRWLTRAGEHGRLGGEYREGAPGERIGGHFLGRWAETSCDSDI